MQVKVLRRISIPLLIFCLGLLALLVLRPLLQARQGQPHLDGPAITSADAAGSSALALATTVNPLTGTGAQAALPAAYSGGETFPGADLPSGMVQWSPDTVHYAYSGYAYGDTRIRGFSLTHLSGAGCSQYGDLPFLPFTASMLDDPAHYSVTFSHADETAYAGYYRVKLGNGVTSELTVTPRSGVGRFTYPAGATAGMLLNLAGSLNPVSDTRTLVGRDTISGSVSSGSFCYLHNNSYRVYFWAQFSQPFVSSSVWRNSTIVSNASEVAGTGAGLFVTFAPAQQKSITLRVGLSYVSVENASANVNQEDPSGDFEQVQQQAVQTWGQALNEIVVRGGTMSQRATFYTALYHALLYPSIFSDANGQYLGFDGKLHMVPPGHAQYTNFSGWDIYHSQAQLLTLLAPNRASDMAQSLLNDYQQGGILPRWPLANGETYVQGGDPADAIISDIYAFGGTAFDTANALAAMIHQATQPNTERPGLHYLDTSGYEPLDGVYGCCNFYGPASATLEYATSDFALSTFAGALGDSSAAHKFARRAQNWRNLYNPATGYLQPRYANGAFPTVSTPADNTGWVEGNSAQYTWMVPFNLRGLFNAMGGNVSVQRRLDTFFTQLDAGLNAPRAFLGNEPSLEVPWEYDYAGAPYKTQRIVRQAVNTLYAASANGLPGNDDLGEMSSWFVFAALGMYPETPGTATLTLASPLFPSITLSRPGGATITINAPAASADTYYVQSLRVNGQPSTRPWLPASFIASGGTLDYSLATTPDPAWGADVDDAPPSYQ